MLWGITGRRRRVYCRGLLQQGPPGGEIVATPASLNQTWRFGVYEVDSRKAELRRDGKPVKMRKQSLLILVYLVEHSGEIVTREELRRVLWPSDTFVDFDHSLNTAIMKLRYALADSADTPLYIETIPKRGYRFIAPLATMGDGPAYREEVPNGARNGLTFTDSLNIGNGNEGVEPLPGDAEAAGPQSKAGAGPARETSAAKAPEGETRVPGRRWVLATVVLVMGGALVIWLWPRHQTKPLTNKDTIVLADFDNKTGDTVFDDTLKQGLSVQLGQSPFLALISERRVNETLKLMGRPAGERLTPEVAIEVCQRTGSKAMMTGSIAGLGGQYVIGMKALNCISGDVLAQAQEQVASKEAVLKALDDVAISMRSKLGESLISVEKYDTPLEEATTPSLEALKAYSLGRRTFYAEGETASLPFYKRAVELDPNFAIVYSAMASVYNDLNEFGLMAENQRKAYDLREKVSEREKFLIEGQRYFFVTGELEKAAQVFELWQQTYPRDDVPCRGRGVVLIRLGNWDNALEEMRQALRLEPNNVNNYVDLAASYAALDRLDETEAVLKQAEERKLEGEFLFTFRYLLAFLKGDAAQMAKSASAAMGKPGTEGLLLAAEADTEGWYGKLKSAHELTERAMDSAQRNEAKETAAGYQVQAALREVEFGNREQASVDAKAAVKLAPNRDVRAVAALALARAGDTGAAEKLAAELDKAFPLDTLVQREWLPTIRASVALERKDPNQAIELLKAARTIELGIPSNLAGALCPVYLRGEAYLMLHDGNRATAEFQKFIDHRGVVMNFPWGALARLGQARAYGLQGDTAKAKSAYQGFLTLWKDADPDIPILKQARAEYGKLQ